MVPPGVPFFMRQRMELYCCVVLECPSLWHTVPFMMCEQLPERHGPVAWSGLVGCSRARHCMSLSAQFLALCRDVPVM